MCAHTTSTRVLACARWGMGDGEIEWAMGFNKAPPPKAKQADGETTRCPCQPRYQHDVDSHPTMVPKWCEAIARKKKSVGWRRRASTSTPDGTSFHFARRPASSARHAGKWLLPASLLLTGCIALCCWTWKTEWRFASLPRSIDQTPTDDPHQPQLKLNNRAAGSRLTPTPLDPLKPAHGDRRHRQRRRQRCGGLLGRGGWGTAAAEEAAAADFLPPSLLLPLLLLLLLLVIVVTAAAATLRRVLLPYVRARHPATGEQLF